MNVVTTDVYETWLRKLKREGSTHRSADPDAGRPTRRREPRQCRGDRQRALGATDPSWPGYRVYYWQQGDLLVVLLCGGDKSTQARDIEKAHEIAKEWENRGKD